MKLNSIKQLQKNHFLYMYEASYTNEEGNEKKYEFVSRSSEIFKDQFGQYKQTDAVGIIVFNKDMNKILLLKEFRLACNNWVYNFPGGMIDTSEDFTDTARRELKEETGLDLIEIIDFMKPAVTAVGLSDEQVSTVLCKAEGEFSKSTSADEEIEAAWYTKDEIKELLKGNTAMSLGSQRFLWMWAYGDKLV